MKKDTNIVDFLQSHYFKRDNFSTLQEMLYLVSEKYKDKTAFVLKDALGYLNNITYYNFVRDVESVGISLISSRYLFTCSAFCSLYVSSTWITLSPVALSRRIRLIK